MQLDTAPVEILRLHALTVLQERCRMLEYATSTDFFLDIAKALLVGLFLLLLKGLWRQTLRFIGYLGTSRKRRRRRNYIEVWRRLKHPEYLVYKEHEAENLRFAIIVVAFTLVLLLQVYYMAPDDEALKLLLVVLAYILVILGLLGFGQADLIMGLNQAARGYQAGMVRAGKSRRFEWPSHPRRRPAILFGSRR
jgi:hypothetical protein